MSSKINIFGIIEGHIWTFKDKRDSKLSLIDIALFFILPIAAALFSGYHAYELSKEVVSNIVTAGVLLSGLLLNLIVLVYNLKEKLPKVDSSDPNHQKVQLKHSVLKELYFNISYATIISFLMLLCAIAHNLLVSINLTNDAGVPTSSVNGSVVDPILIFLGLNLILSFFMIIKRTYKLLISDD